MLPFNTFAIILLLQVSMQVCSNYYLDDADNDPGEPLFLTPYIKDGRILEAQQAASFPGGIFRIPKGYSGFLTVNQTYNSNTFFLYLPSPTSPETAPVVIWLDGGPGVTSFVGLFQENGPVTISLDGKVIPNQYSWHDFCSFIYIDNPVNVGFSFTEDDAGYATDFDQIGRDLYEAVQQLHVLFPQLQNLPLYVGGSSYAGRYVAALGYRIHLERRSPITVNYQIYEPPMLTGLIFAGAIQDVGEQFYYGNYLYDIGLVDENALDLFKSMEAKMHHCIENGDPIGTIAITKQLIHDGSGNTMGTILHNLTGYTSAFNSLQAHYFAPTKHMIVFINSPEFRRLVHLGNVRFHPYVVDSDVHLHLEKSYDFSAGPWVAELLNTYRVCSLHGQFDIVLPYSGTAKYYEAMQFDGANAYKSATRLPLKDDGELAGYIKKGGNLVEAMIRNAGHLVITDQPKWVHSVVSRCLRGESFDQT